MIFLHAVCILRYRMTYGVFMCGIHQGKMGKIEIDILYCSQNNEHFTYAGQMKYLQTRDFKWMSTQ